MMKEDLFYYDMGECDRYTDWLRHECIGIIGQFRFQNYYRAWGEENGKKVYPMWTMDGKDEFTRFFNREELDLDNYNLKKLDISFFPKGGWTLDGRYIEEPHYGYYDSKWEEHYVKHYEFNSDFSLKCQEEWNKLGSPKISIHIRETDKMHDNGKIIPSSMILEFLRQFKDEPIFVGSDSNYTLNILKKELNIKCFDIVRSDTFQSQRINRKYITNEKVDTELHHSEAYMKEMWIYRNTNSFFTTPCGSSAYVNTMNHRTGGGLMKDLLPLVNLTEREKDMMDFYSLIGHHLCDRIVHLANT